MGSNKRITALVMLALSAGMMTALLASVQTSQVDNPDWPLRSSEIHWPAGHAPADADLSAHNDNSQVLGAGEKYGRHPGLKQVSAK
jgi:hypothetical protein